MKELVTYLIEISVLLSGFYFFWIIFFRNETFYKINRLYLIISILISIVLPIFSFTFENASTQNSVVYLLESVTIKGNELNNSLKSYFSSTNVFVTIYFSGVFVFFIKFLIQVISIIKLIFSKKAEEVGKYKIIKLSKQYSSFSFLNYIFISENEQSNNDYQKIIKHEEIHVNQLHSLDNFFMETIKILLWFNPIIYFYHKALKETHEYLADEGVLEQGFDSTKYQLLLLEQSIGVQYSFANNLNKSLTLKRLAMMNKQSSKLAKLKLLLVLPLVSLMFLVFSCSDNQELKKAAGEFETQSEIVKIDDGEMEVFEEVEEMPEFPGGQNALFQFITSNVVYPEEAMKNDIQGKVYVSFVITKEGKVDNVEIAKSVALDLDAEAKRVIEILPDWTPGKIDGKNVNVAFTIPINFQLSDEK